MRIVHLLSQTHLTGAEAHAVRLAESFIDQGHEVFIISDKLHLKTRAQSLAMPIHSSRGFGRWIQAYTLRKFLIRNQIDVVHAHSRAAVRISWWATRRTRVAMVSTIHGRQHFSWGKRLFDTYGERVIAICGSLRTHLIQDFKMRAARVSVIHNPVTLPAKMSPVPASPLKWLFITRWTGPKGERAIEFLESIAPHFLKIVPELQIDLCGAYPEPGSRGFVLINILSKKYGERFRHRGFIDPVEPEIANYGLVFGGGRIAIAAIGSGVPCFAFGEAETPGLIRTENFEAALYTNFGDIVAGHLSQPLDRSKALRNLTDFLNEGVHKSELETLQQKIFGLCGEASVASRILSVYRSAIFLKFIPRPIPILMYHQVVAAPIDTPHRIFVTEQTFRMHLETFRRRGLVSLTFEDLLDFKEGRKPFKDFPRKPVILTFDDGYENNLKAAAPLLKEFGFKGVIYLLADSGLKKNTWDEGASPQVPLMTADQRQELFRTGTFEIGSHGFRHEKLPGMTDDQAMKELTDSKAALEQEFPTKILSYAFTYGDINEKSAELARKAGYAYALNTDQGGLTIEENPWSIFRVNVFPEDTAFTIAKKASWWYRHRYFRKRGR